MLRLDLFGTLRLWRDDSPLELATPPKTLHLLAYLLIHRHTGLTRNQVAFALWPDRPEAEARGQLRRYLYRLRQLLPEGSWLKMRGDQVQWNTASDYWLDVEEFERLGHGKPDQLEASLKLYTDDLLADLYEDWVIIERERLRALYFENLSRLIDFYREEQVYDRAIACAQQILKREPLQENIVRELMRLRAAAGDRTGALEDYRQFQQRVLDELGVPPLPETLALYETLRHATFAPAAPTPQPLVRHTAARPVNVPVPLTRLLGRESELATVCDRLQSRHSGTRLLTLTGPGGAGKTRLAQEAAQRLAQRTGVFGDGIFYVSLSSLISPDSVLPAMASVLDVAENGQRSLPDAIKEALHNKDLLLILDNFEHVLEAAPFINECLAIAPELRVLVTSREPLHLYGEHEFEVPPLPLPDLDHLPPAGELLNYAAIALFVERARAVKGDFALDADNAAAVAEICTRLDGLPLAIELAAARSKLFTPQAMLQPLADRLRFLIGQGRDLPHRQRTLRSVIDWSYNLLSDDEKMLFARLSVFAGSFTAEAVEALRLAHTDRANEPPVDVFDQLAALVDKNMLRAVPLDPSGDERRFRWLLTLREYAQERLIARGEFDELHLRHAGYRLAVAQQSALELSGQQQAGWMRRLDADRDNFRAVLTWTLEYASGQAEIGLRLTAALGKFWALHGDWAEGEQWLRRALTQNPHADPVWRARALNIASELADKLGDISQADALATESLALFRGLGETRGLADALCNLAGARLTQNDYARAEPLLIEALTLYRQLDFPAGIATALSYLSMLAKEQGDYDRAVACLEEGLALNRRMGNVLGIVQDLIQLSFNAYWQGQYARSADLAHQSLDLARHTNNRRAMAIALDGIGAALGRLDRYEEAGAYLIESLTLYRDLGNKSGQAMVLADWGMMTSRQGERARATQLFRESLALAWSIGDRRRIAFCLEGLGQSVSEVDPEQAVRWLSAAQALRQEIPAPLPPSEQDLFQQALDRLTVYVGSATLEALWQRTQSLPLDEVVMPLLDGTY